ncbi:MAG: ComEA family DNA-binding protein [Candidatus Onthomonas sp.]
MAQKHSNSQEDTKRRGPSWVTLLLAAAFVGYLCYLVGWYQASVNRQDFTLRTEYTVSETELYQSGENAGPESTPSDDAASLSPDTKIDLNHADADTLQQLPGIGPERANAIIEYREEYGIFVTTDEVMNVPGIGPEIYEQIKDYVTVEYK